jgi:patatin-like phospholipase/acyl hydrolase
LKALKEEIIRRIPAEQIDAFRFKDCFDMVAGTSVGALVGASLLLGKEGMVYENFQNYAKEIFQKRMGAFRSHAYHKSGRKRVISHVIGNEDLPARDVGGLFVVPFFCYNTGEAKIYQNFGEGFHDFTLFDLLMMTSAAPTYFAPHYCKSITNGNPCSGGDGGLFANNPSLITYILAKKLFPEDPIFFISLGTGEGNRGKSIHYYDKVNLLDWARTYPDISIAATSDSCHGTMEFLSEQSQSNMTYYRLQVKLGKEDMKMDNTQPEIFESILSSVRSFINRNGERGNDFREIVHILTQIFLQKINGNA